MTPTSSFLKGIAVSNEKGIGSMFDRLRLLAEWGPLLSRIQLVAVATTPHDQAKAVMECLLWVTGKTETSIDDRLVARMQAVLATPQGKDLFDEVIKIIGEVIE